VTPLVLPYRTIFFTEKEQKILDTLVQTKNYQDTARLLMMKVGTVRATLFRIRLRYDNAIEFVKACEQYQKQLPRKKRYVTG